MKKPRATIGQLISFTGLLSDFRLVDRTLWLRGSNRPENDAEHSYALATAALYLISVNKLKLNLAKVLSYALIHDLVEVHAGDTFFYQTDPKAAEKKQKREHAAAQKLAKTFPEFTEMHALIKAYELRKDKESRFVYVLDKVLPMIQIYLDGGKTWHKCGTTYQMAWDGKRKKVTHSPEMEAYFHELMRILKKKEKRLFGKKVK